MEKEIGEAVIRSAQDNPKGEPPGSKRGDVEEEVFRHYR
jgi:hypothetical protein